MSEKKAVVIGTVGYGYGAFLHVNGYLNAGGIPIRLKTVCARNQEKAEAFRAKYGYEEICDSYDKLVADPEIDLIDLSVPPALHIPYAIKALKANKNIIVEKPITGYFGKPGEENIGRTVKKADMWATVEQNLADLKKAIDESEGQFFYAEDFVYATPVQKAAEILRAKKSKIVLLNGMETIIGSSTPLASEWRNFGGGTIMRNGIHILTTMMYLKQVEAQARGEKITVRSVVADVGCQTACLSDAEHQYIQAHPNDVEDVASITVTFSDGTKCVTLCSDAVLGGSENHVNVCCHDMSFQLNLTQTNLLKAYCMDENGLENVGWGELVRSKLGWNNVFVSDEVIRGYTGEMKAFLEAIVSGKKPETSFELASEVIRVIYAAYRSAEEGRRIEL